MNLPVYVCKPIGLEKNDEDECTDPYRDTGWEATVPETLRSKSKLISIVMDIARGYPKFFVCTAGEICIAFIVGAHIIKIRSASTAPMLSVLARKTRT